MMSELESGGDKRKTSAGEGEGAGRSKVLPLNSRGLSATVLRKLAHAMDLPVSVTGEELRQLIDGKLIATGKEHKNVQVLVSVSEAGEESLALQDQAGVFVEVIAETGAAANPESEAIVTDAEATPVADER